MDDIFDSVFEDNNPEEKDQIKQFIIDECWKYFDRDPELVLDNFIIYVVRPTYTYILPPQGMSRLELLDYLIEHFENKESFEKCGHLLNIKNKILRNINKFKSNG